MTYYANITIIFTIPFLFIRAQFWPFIQCMDEMGEDQDYSVAEACAKKPSIDMNWSMIDSCTKGALGHQLELMYANITNSLQPPHRYTPWITINGKVCMSLF